MKTREYIAFYTSWHAGSAEVESTLIKVQKARNIKARRPKRIPNAFFPSDGGAQMAIWHAEVIPAWNGGRP